MSPRALLYDPELRPARDLYDVLDDLLRADPSAVVTASQLATVLGVSDRHVRRLAARLEAAGWLARGPQVGRSSGSTWTPLRRPRPVSRPDLDARPGTLKAGPGCPPSPRDSLVRNRAGEEAEAAAAAPAPWCGRCDSAGYRFVVDELGLNPRRCPACHPASTMPAPF